MSFLRLILLTIMITSLGCLEAKKKPVDYGPEFTPQAVSQAIGKPLKDYTPLNMQKGDRVAWAFYYYVKNNENDKKVAALFENEVLSRTETSDKLDFKIQTTVGGWDKDNKPTTDVTPWDYTVVKPLVSTESLMSLFNLNLFSEAPLNASSNRTTYHRLQVVEDLYDLSGVSKDKSGCAKFENCMVPATYVHFEKVVWKPEGAERFELDYFLTPHLPFVSMLHSDAEQLPANLKTCLTQQVTDKSGKKFVVTFCTELTDFAFGKTE